MISGKLEVTIKINELPTSLSVENGWQMFHVNCDGQVVSVTVKPKIWKKLTDADANFPLQIAAIAGKIGIAKADGFELLEPNIQVFERKPKAESTQL